MAKVRILPSEVVSKIAAGEVIERPASVVKELLENALDAHTSSIDLHLKAGGRSLIHIKDTGEGIDSQDMEKIFLRHATSKIAHLNDLYNIISFGFRGEALYSIAAVSDITLRSKPPQQEIGWEIHLRGGEKISFKPFNIPAGTEVMVRELFFNTPARRKFLRTDLTELHHIINTCLPYILLYYQCSFCITHNNRTILNLSSHPDILTRIEHTLKLKKENLLYKEHQLPQQKVSFTLILGDINIQRPRKDYQFIFINNRPVQNKLLSFYLNQAYRPFFSSDVYPFFCLILSLPPHQVDVNVHPTKREVKLKKEQSIASCVREVCEKTLSFSKAKQSTSVPLPPSSSSQDNAPEIQGPAVYQQQYLFPEETTTSLPVLKESTDMEPTTSPSYSSLSSVSFKQTSLWAKLKNARYIGTFTKKYLLFETETSLLIIDQHAAQERIIYETFLNQLKEGKLAVQYLLNPILISISAQEKIVWEKVQEKLEELGFSTTQWNEETIALHTHPQLIKNPEFVLRNFLSPQQTLITHIDKETLARRACRSSIMAGYEMIKEEAELLRSQLLTCQVPLSCPHGRPTVIELTEHTLDKEFCRR